MNISAPYYSEGVYHHEANKFLLLAVLALDRCRGDEVALDANVAQIMAAVAAEAFIEEFAFTLATLRLSRPSSNLARVGSILQDLETSRVQVTEKYRIATRVLPGVPYDAGRQPFQSFAQLIKLRNYLAHPKMLDKPPGWFTYFVRNRLVLHPPESQHVSPVWTAQLQNRQCAGWACRATSRIVLDLIERVYEPCKSENALGVYETLVASWDWSKTDSRIWSGAGSDGI